MSWNTILFDLDGTVTDPKEGITKAAAAALASFGIHEEPDDLTRFIGPPLDESFPEFYGFDGEQTNMATVKFREYFARQGWLENVPYPGMSALLAELRAAGKRLVIATSKPEVFAVKILEHFGMARYFDVICGAPLDNQAGAKKAAVIRSALKRAGIDDLRDAVMVGDRRHDIAGAHEVGLEAVGVLYGYGSREEHEAAGADLIAEDIAALKKLLLEEGEVAERWLRAFGAVAEPLSVEKYVRGHTCFRNYLWHLFSFELAPCLVGDEARAAFDGQEYDAAFVFRGGYTVCHGPHILEDFEERGRLSAADLEGEADVYVVDRAFRWTYVHTHEGGCGPYFCRRK